MRSAPRAEGSGSTTRIVIASPARSDLSLKRTSTGVPRARRSEAASPELKAGQYSDAQRTLHRRTTGQRTVMVPIRRLAGKGPGTGGSPSK